MRFEQFRDWLQLVHEEPDGAVYLVRRPETRWHSAGRLFAL
jgi:hypothetical protein